MKDSVLTSDQILEAAAKVLRRYGPSKATVVDVARVLGVSHGSVYRHFPSKAALRDAVTEQWLADVSEPLATIAAEETPAPERLGRWLNQLIHAKRQRALEDPELFATYIEIAADSREVVKAHVDNLVAQLSRMIMDGIAQGEFAVADAPVAARAVFDATNRFHNPAHASEWTDSGIDAAFEGVWTLILRGLGGGASSA